MGVAAVVVAAGQGVRFGGLKQFLDLDGASVAAHSVAAARSHCQPVVLVVPKDYAGDGEGADLVVSGGDSRAASVRAGLAACGDAEIVVVHDAARPNASPQLFARVIDAVREGADGAIPGLVLTDTIKRVTVEGSSTLVAETLVREELVSVQTPQAFRADLLRRAHEEQGEASDDAGLVEAVGGRVVVVEGEATNYKITNPSDVELARRVKASHS